MKAIKLGVDAGNISVADLDYIQDNKGAFGEAAEKMCHKIEMDPGVYSVILHINNCWLGDVTKSFIFKTNGTVVIGDVCYLFSADEPSNEYWDAFLDKTEYLQKANENYRCVDTGGDGAFAVTYNFEKVS